MQQRNEVLVRIREANLDPLDFDWTGDTPSRQIVDGLVYRPLQNAYFAFLWNGEDWGVDYAPAPGVPAASAWLVNWSQVPDKVSQWLEACRAEVVTPDLWAALQRERDAIARPAEGDGNEPFTAAELSAIAEQLAALKEYARGLALDANELREIDAKLDYLVGAAQRAPGRIDWWNQAVGAIISLTLTAAVQPQVMEALLTTFAHGLGYLYGGGPPQLPS